MELYKYMSAESFEKHIINGPTIRFTRPWEFNDPFEFKPAILVNDTDNFLYKFNWIYDQSIENVYKKTNINLPIDIIKAIFQCKKKEMAEKNMLIIRDRLIEKDFFQSRLKLGVFCATSNDSNILMWSHYADNHNGVAISFDSDDNFFKKFKIGFRKVTYREDRPTYCVGDDLNCDIFYTKSVLWSYENEYRLVAYLDNDISRVKIDNNGVCNLPHSVIKKIIFGYRIPKDKIKKIYQKISTIEDFRSVSFYKAEMDKLEYKLNIVPLEG